MRSRDVLLAVLFGVSLGCAHVPPDAPPRRESSPQEEDSGFLLLGKSAAARMAALARGHDGDRAALAKAAKAAVCDGRRPRHQPVWQVQAIAPKPLPGTPLDLASSHKLKYMAAARQWIGERFFFEAATAGLIIDRGGDYWDYTHAPQAADWHVMGVAAPGTSVARVAPFEDDGLPKDRMVDLTLMLELFTHELPIEVTRQLYAQSDPKMVERLGFDSTRLSASGANAIQERLWIWEQLLAVSTRTKEAPQKDGSILFEASLDLTLFCAYGVAITDLVTE